MCCRRSCRRCSSAFPTCASNCARPRPRILIEDMQARRARRVLLALPVDEADIETLRAVRRSVPARGAGRAIARPQTARASCARHRSAAADPARGRPLPARSGAGVLRGAARGDVRAGARRDQPHHRDADGRERLRRHAGAADRGRRRAARRAGQVSCASRPRAGRTIGLAWRRTSPRKADFTALGQIVRDMIA